MAKKPQKTTDAPGIPAQPQRAEDRPEADEDDAETRPTNKRPAVSNPEDNSATSGDGGAASIHPR